MIQPIDLAQYESLYSLLLVLKKLGIEQTWSVWVKFRLDQDCDWEICKCGEVESECACLNINEDDDKC